MRMNFCLKLLLLPALPAAVSGQTTPEPPVHSKITYYQPTARPADQIEHHFPFDISLATSEGDTLNSAVVLSPNGKPTVLLFWLTTCVPCRQELTAISAKFEAWKKLADFNFHAISVDFPKNREQFIRRVGESKWAFPAWLDLHREFQFVLPGELNGVPQVFVFDKNGNIAYHKRKYYPGAEDELFDAIQKLE